MTAITDTTDRALIAAIAWEPRMVALASEWVNPEDLTDSVARAIFAALVKLGPDASQSAVVAALDPSVSLDIVDEIAAVARASGPCASSVASAARTIAERTWDRPVPPPKPTKGKGDPTELWLAQQLVSRHGENLRYVHATRSWYLWDGQHWAPDVTGRVNRLAVDILDGKGISKLERSSHVNGAVTLAGWKLSTPADYFDIDPWLLTVRNGTLDLRTGRLREHDRSDMLTRMIDFPYEPAAGAPRFTRFLDEVMDGDREMITFLRRWCGYCLTADTTEHVIVFFTGTGRNGKGALIRLLQHVMGAFIATAPEGLLTVTKFERHPAELEVLRGRRLVIASEFPKVCSFSEARVKQLTGGDTVAARGMRENFTELRPTAKIIVQANHKPRVTDDSVAFWERMRIVEFPVSFLGREDRGLDDVLQGEAVGVLSWLVAGCLEWRRERLPRLAKVEAATASYRLQEDVVGRWELDRVERQEAMSDVPASVLWADFERWIKEEGERPMSQTTFGKELTSRGWTRDRTARGILRSHPLTLLKSE